MKAKVHLLRIDAVLASVSLLGVVLIHFLLPCADSIFENIAYGIFCSSFATLIILIAEYHNDKKRTLTLFCSCVFDILDQVSKIAYITTDENGKADAYISKCWPGFIPFTAKQYVDIGETARTLEERFGDLCFFCDFSLCDWWKSRRLKRVLKRPNSKAEEKLQKEKAKAIYRQTDYPGEQKKTIQREIYFPLTDLITEIHTKSRNAMKYYLCGDKAQEEAVVSSFLELQKILFTKSSDGSVEKARFISELNMKTYGLLRTLQVAGLSGWNTSKEI